MELDIRVGDIVSHTAAGTITETKVKRKVGRYLIIDVFEGPFMIYKKDKVVLENDVTLMMKGSTPKLTLFEVRNLLMQCEAS